MATAPRARVVVVDDHEVVRRGLCNASPALEVVGGFATVEAFLGDATAAYDAVLLDLQLDGPENVTPTGGKPLIGTAAIRAIIDAGRGPIVIYTAITEDMLLAGCLAAGALGAVSKNSTISAIVDTVAKVAAGRMWVDPVMAAALTRLAEQRHAGALSPQQANTLRYRAQGLKQHAIAARIGVKDEETVHRYLKAAVDKLAEIPSARGSTTTEVDDDQHPGTR